MATPFLQVVPQRHTMDCSVACLAMLLGVSYETVLMAFRHNVIAQGATVRQIRQAASFLGRNLRWSRKFDLESDTGILGVRSTRWKSEHVVVLKEGLVVDTDATVWDTDVFISAYEAQAVSLMTIVNEET